MQAVWYPLVNGSTSSIENMTSSPEEVTSLTTTDDLHQQTTSTPNEDDTDYVLDVLYWYNLGEMMLICALPVLMTLGVVLNGVAFFVMARNALHSATYVYVAVLAILDLFTAVCNCLILAGQYLWKGRYDMTKLAGCETMFILRSLLPVLSSWTLVLFTIERTLLVYIVNTGLTNRIKRPRTAVILICLTFAGVCITHWNLFGGIKALGEVIVPLDICTGVTSFLTWYKEKVFPWVFISVYIYLPATLLFALNIAIAVRFCRAALNAPHSTQTNSEGQTVHTSVTLQKEAKRVTLTVVCLSMLFLVTMTPFTVAFTLYYVQIDSLPGNDLRIAQLAFGGQVTQLFSTLNHCLNAIVYLVFSPTFRRLLCACRID